MTTRDAVFGAALLALGLYAGCQDRQRAAFETRARSAEAADRRHLALANVAAESAAYHQREAAQLRQQVRGQVQVIAALRDSLTPGDTVFVTAPAECASVVEQGQRYRALADRQFRAIVTYIEAARQDSLALDQRAEEAHQLRAANDTLRQALASRPGTSFWVSLIPKPYAGYGMTLQGGALRAGPTVGIGWQLRF